MWAAEWTVYQADLGMARSGLFDMAVGPQEDFQVWADRLHVRNGQWFALGPSGFPDRRINKFLGCARFAVLADTTKRDYAHSLSIWLRFLDSRGTVWWEATQDDVEEFRFWRLTDPANVAKVQSSTVAKDIAACKKFYKWASDRYGDVADVFGEAEFPSAKRQASVKWVDPPALSRWFDLGLRGRDLTGRVDPAWRGRHEQRDFSFAYGLYATALRLSEWSSVVLPELPAPEARHGFYKCRLADACAKGGYGHPYWISLRALTGVGGYIEGARAHAIRKAQHEGTYEALCDRLMVEVRPRGMVTVPTGNDGAPAVRSWNVLGPSLRRRMFLQTKHGLEPLWLWLNEDGLPRDPHGWHHVFDTANRRIASLGLENFRVTPHMLRHSAALRWFSIGKLLYTRQISHLNDSEAADFRGQFGDTWDLVQTILGHRQVETTRSVYLEPFRNLSVEVLLAHTEDLDVESVVAQFLAGHPQVITDPVVKPR